MLVYVIPALGLLLAAGGIAFAAIRWRRRGDGTGRPRRRAGAAADSRRVDLDMERYDL